MDEYELINKKEVAAFLSGFTGFISRLVRFMFTSIRRQMVLTVSMFLLLSAAAFTYWYLKPPYFESDLVCSYNHMHQKTYGEMLKKLDDLAKVHSVGELSEILNISQKQAGSILRVIPTNSLGSPLYDDYSDNANLSLRFPIYITVLSLDRDVYKPLQEGIVNYLNNTPYRKVRSEIERHTREEKIWYIDRSMAQIDSLVDAYTRYLKNVHTQSDSITGFTAITSLLAYKDVLQDKKLDKEYYNAVHNSIEVIHGFTPADRPVRTTKEFLFGLIGLALVTSCLLSVIINFFRSGME
ncbi:MAG: hypothetical protein JST82_16240 [Bacteroidetes bacterium]|nr:hypothetical protein [Bacteroidota bacterium]